MEHLMDTLLSVIVALIWMDSGNLSNNGQIWSIEKEKNFPFNFCDA